MGVDSKKAPPLPAPTDTDSISHTGTGTELATEVSRFTEQTSQTLPEDGTPVTLSTRKTRHKSQTSLLIEYFEGGKGSETETRKPSVRVKVTPSSKSRSGRSKGDDHIQITETRGNRKPSYTKRINLSSPKSRDDKLRVEGDNNSLSSYASATEESNVSRNPIEVEVMPRRHGSPLIPTGDSRQEVNMQLGSDVSSMPANSFLDGKTRSPEHKRSRSLTRAEVAAAGVATGLAAGAVADKLKTPSRRRSRSLSRERIVAQKVAEKVKGDKSSERRRKHSSGSRSRSVSNSEKYTENIHSPRRRSSRHHQEDISLLSGTDPSQLSGSRLSGDQRSFRSGTSKGSSINNPKLLETVEDAIRRLILPELTALKKEQKAHGNRDKFDRDRRGSITSGSTGLSRESREEIRKVSSGRSSGPDVSSKSRVVVDGKEVLSGDSSKLRKERKSDHLRDSSSPRTFERGESEETVIRDDGGRLRTKHSSDKKSGLGALAAGLGLGALTAHALQNQSRENLSSRDSLDERSERRRRRTKSKSRSSLTESYEEQHEIHPPMPLMSDVNASDITRSSILSAETERPHSASAERIMTKEVRRGLASPASKTPTRSPRSLTPNDHTPTQRATSSDDLSGRTGSSHGYSEQGEYDLDEHGRKVLMHRSEVQVREQQGREEEEPESDHFHAGRSAAAVAAGALLGAGAMHHYGNKVDDGHDIEESSHDDYYQNQGVVPPPLKYVPYNQEKRGLSPIQSVSGYTEDEIGHSGNQPSRDSRLTHSTGSYSTEQSPQHRQSGTYDSFDHSPSNNHHDFAEVRHGGLTDSELTQDHDREYWDEQHRENDRNRDFDEESYHSSNPRVDYKHITDYPDDSLDAPYQSDRAGTGQSVKGVGGRPDFVHTPIGVESAVASLVDASVLTGNSGHSGRSNLDRHPSYTSYDEGSERHFTSRGTSPTKHDTFGSREFQNSPRQLEESQREVTSIHSSPKTYPEYELDEQGRKVAMPEFKDSHTTAKTAAAGIVGAAAGAAVMALADHHHQQPEVTNERYQERLETTGAPLQKSFKDRAKDLQPLSPRHSVDRFDDEGHDHVKMSASGIPDANDPMPEIGAYHDDVSEAGTRHSYAEDPLGSEQKHDSRDRWNNYPTSKHPKIDTSDAAVRSQNSDSRLKTAELGLVAAAGAAGGAAALAAHNRETGHDHQDEEWARTSDERKRDTLITNPYEGTSPVTLLGGQQDRNLLGEMGYDGVNNEFNPEYNGAKLGYSTGSPGHLAKDEGYISSAPNAISPGPGRRAKEVGFMDDVGMGGAGGELAGDDPFYTPKHTRHLSGLSNGMSSPLYDSATGAGIDRIQSKDIVALMDHLTVRDAQRSARDTEILVTLVRAAAEMRNSFEDMKRLLADTEDVIITEVQRNTDKSVQRVINGPRPPPASGPRSLRGSQDEMIDDIPNKRRNVFRRALKGLSMRSSNDLAKIEDMLVQLLGDVEGLKVAQGLSGRGPQGDEYDDMQQEGAYEQDRGYEPEGNAGSTTASHASQSGHFSNVSRGPSAPRGDYSRRYSENRISTVPEGDEDELDIHEQAVLNHQFENNEQLLTPTRENVRGGSAPLGTPPQQHVAPASLSNENTPTTGKSKRSTWNPIPKISRWSETTASSVAKNFRSSGRRDTQDSQEPASRSGSDLGNYEHPHNPYGEDKLHSGFSNDELGSPQFNDNSPTHLTSLLPPEDPKYKAHRNSLNLQHPQPRPGPTQRYQTALESQAQDFDTPMSPKSLDWGGSSSSINRLPPNSNANPNRYSNEMRDTGHLSPGSDGYSAHSGGQSLAPARPPKEPITSNGPELPPKIMNKLTKPSPLSSEHLPDDDIEEYQGSPRRVLSANLSVPTRKPTGPRSMGGRSPRGSGAFSGGEAGSGGEGRRKRDTFGTVASNHSAHSAESETF